MTYLIFFYYLCPKMDNCDLKDRAFVPKLVALCDLAEVVAILTAACCWRASGLGLATVMAMGNLVLITGIRIWIMRVMGVCWLKSWLNLTLKKAADLIVGCMVAVFVLPVLIIVAMLVIKIADRGAVFEVAEAELANGRRLRCLKFRRSGTFFDIPLIGRSPMVLNVLLWQMGLSDILRLRIVENSKAEVTADERHTDDSVATEPDGSESCETHMGNAKGIVNESETSDESDLNTRTFF